MLYSQCPGGMSYSHFTRRYNHRWANILRFAHPTNFPACDDCTAYKTAFEDSTDALDKFTISKQYKSHLDAVGEDRKFENWLQDSKPGDATLLIHADGMDQSKWVVPRRRHHLLTKSLSKYDRPKSKLQGIWLHGFAMFLYVLEPRLAGDGSMVSECLVRSLDKMHEYCTNHNIAFPRRVMLWVDNTVKESKNNTVYKLLSFILLQKGLELVGICMSRVGHTHGCLDQCFGIISRAMKFVDDLADDDDIVEKVTRIVQKVNLKAWLGSATVYVEKLESVRDFKSWLEHAPVRYAGALKDDISGAHSFVFLRRRDGQSKATMSSVL
ncbi:unnamed protein product [Durusdinium trenchii]|uniref:DUF7869 domain-containing protein n=1 Tax=Durusdinium trenchii TaxID=1381693 RepID=A0ABP0MFR2_9DINO